MDSLKNEKIELRKLIKELKKAYSFEQKKEMSKPIWKEIEKKDWFKNSNIVLAYWSMKDELYTHDFVIKWYKEKTILLPCVEGDILKLRQFEGIESMKEGEAFSIMEPTGKKFEDIGLIDLMIIPAVAFDKNNNRLGRGKGFYDRLLENNNSLKVGVCFPFQFLEKIPAEEFDVKMDYVIK
ncbi:MAG: 5-formyltetrahydrofolate cyclo-ligase [Candidatus Pacebacteria bacterium]|nr:5-formyltetrahydrofolate cyclo-ligase [Candidatus Paceibacterota bacterium]